MFEVCSLSCWRTSCSGWTRGRFCWHIDFFLPTVFTVFAPRVLGGLLSAYDLSGDKVFLEKARDIADRLLPAWNTPSGIPYTLINLAYGNAHNPHWTGVSSEFVFFTSKYSISCFCSSTCYFFFVPHFYRFSDDYYFVSKFELLQHIFLKMNRTLL